MNESKKLKKLLDQKERIDGLLKIEKDKKSISIGRLAIKHGFDSWSTKALNNLFKEALKNGEAFYLNK